MTRTCNSLVALALLAAGSACGTDDPAALDEDTAALDPEGQIVVMTQNQYVGADLRPVLTARDEPTFQAAIRTALDRISANRFRVRSVALALQIAMFRPDVVALQEVFDITLNGAHGAGPWRDHLADTLAALAVFGVQYQVVAQVQNMSATLPADLDNNGTREAQVRLTDRDVILVRSGLAATVVPFPARCARPSRDGCNFQIVPVTNLPSGRLVLERGWVGVDVAVNGRDYRIVNTHLDDRDVEGPDPVSGTFQSMQMNELITMIEQTQPGARTVIVLGDLASRPEDEAVIIGTLPIVPPYIILRTNGFRDVWTQAPAAAGPAPTCCQAENLRNGKSRLDRRNDHVFSTTQPVAAQVDVIGDSSIERALLHGWPSDHGTVVARLRYPVGPQPVLPPPAPASEGVLDEGP